MWILNCITFEAYVYGLLFIGVSVHVSNAAPKQDNRKHFNNDRSGGNRDGPVWSDSQGSGGGGNSRYNDTGSNNWGGNQGGFRGGNNLDASNFNPLSK